MSLGSTLTAAAFWLGTLLPIVYVPVILLGLDSFTRLALFVGLLGLNVLALSIGRNYPETRSRRRPNAPSNREASDSTSSE